jgi:hypothetical protein
MSARVDALRVDRVFECRATGARERELGALLARSEPARTGGLDAEGVAAEWGEREPEGGRTWLRGVRVSASASASASASTSASASASTLASLLPLAAGRALASSSSPVVALGGGVDAPLAVLAARRAGIHVARAITVAIPGTSYDESVAATAIAAALGLELEVVHLDVAALVDALPAALRVTSCALYNLHPVSRALLSRAARARGHDVLLTGDGADQAARGAREPADYVPLVAALTRAAALRWAAPFADDDVAVVLAAGVDALPASRDPKAALRRLAVHWGLPEALAFAPKRPTYAPPLPRAAFPPSRRVTALARALGRDLGWSDDDRRNVGVTSLSALVDAFRIEI